MVAAWRQTPNYPEQGTGCTILTDFPVIAAYGMDAKGNWELKTPVPAGFVGPINIQHLVRFQDKGWQLESTDAARIGY